MIGKVLLENWKSHSRSEFDFSKGTNVLLGIMGSGKSSLLSAIIFAFFGETPDTHAKRSKLDDLIMSRPSEASYAQVEVFFDYSGEKYSIKRRLERGEGSTEAQLRKDGRLIEGPLPKKVTSAVSLILGIDYDLFVQAVYLEQNQIDSFLSSGKSDRRRKLDEFFGINKVEDARQTLLSAVGKLRAELEILGREAIAENLSEKKSLAEEEKGEIRKSERELDEKREFLRKAISEGEILARKISELEKIKSQMDRTSSQERLLEKNNAELKKKLSNYSKTGDRNSRSELQALQKERREVEQFTNSISSIKGRLSLLEAKEDETRQALLKLSGAPDAAEAEEAFRKADKAASDISGRLNAEKALFQTICLKEKMLERKREELPLGADETFEKLTREFSEISGKIVSINGTLETEREALNLLEKGGDSCPVCDSPLTHEKTCSIRKEKQEKVTELIRSLSNSSQKKVMLERKVSEAKMLFARFTTLTAEINSLSYDVSAKVQVEGSLAKSNLDLLKAGEERKNKEKDLLDAREKGRLSKEATSTDSSLKAEKSALIEFEGKLSGRTLDSLSAKIEEKRLLSEAYDIQEQLGGNEKFLSDARAKFSKLREGFSQEIFEGAKGKLSETNKEKGALEYAVFSLPKEIGEKKARLLRVEKEILELEGKIKRKERVQKALDFTRTLDLALKATEEVLRAKLTEQVNSALFAFWSSLYPYEDFSGLRLRADEQDYLLELECAGKWQEVERVASGGEKSIACLALRIAFANVLAPQLRWLILDEPTHNLDRAAIGELAQVLRERISSIVDQVILITHEEEMESATTGYCYRLERSKAGESTRVLKIAGGEL